MSVNLEEFSRLDCLCIFSFIGFKRTKLISRLAAVPYFGTPGVRTAVGSRRSQEDGAPPGPEDGSETGDVGRAEGGGGASLRRD